MSEAVQLGLIGWMSALSVGLAVPTLTHFLGRRDRLLADSTVKEITEELEEAKNTWEVKEKSYIATIEHLSKQVIELGGTPWSPA